MNSDNYKNLLIKYLKNYKSNIIIASIYSIFNKFFDILPEILIGIAVDTVVNQKHSFLANIGITSIMSQLILLGFLTLITWTLESIFEYLSAINWRYIAQTFQHNLRLKTYKHILNFRMKEFDKMNSGNLISLLTEDVNQLEKFLDKGINEIIHLIVSTIIIGFIFLYVSPIIGIISLIQIPIITLITLYFQKQISYCYKFIRIAAATITSKVNNSIKSIITIKSYNAQEYETAMFKNKSKCYQQASIKAVYKSALFIPAIRMSAMCSFIATLTIGGWLVINNKLAVGSYSMLIYLTQRFLWPFASFGPVIDSYQRALASLNRIQDILNLPIYDITQGKEIIPSEVSGAITFENINFKYPEGPEIFKDLSFNIPSKKTVAFVGPSGSGKSTIIRLLLRLYKPQSGQILIDNHNLEEYSIKSSREVFSFVSQDPHLVDNTISQNIIYGTKCTINKDHLYDAAKKAQAYNFIEKLPQKFDTIVGETADKLSGGQKQRICIARAMYKEAPIFIFDEATSALDNETEKYIQDSLQSISKDHTIIVVAHRLNSIKNADIIFVLDQGVIVEQGTHDELLNQSGLYSQLWKVQQ